MVLTKAKRKAVLWWLLAAIWFAVNTASPLAAGKQRFVTIGTGGPEGVYAKAGNAICAILNRDAMRRKQQGAKTEILCVAPNTGGSIFNLSQLYNRSFDFGMAQSDLHYHTYHGTLPETVKPNKKIRSVFSLHIEPVRLVVTKQSGIQEFNDLKKKRVNIGNPGSGQRATIAHLMHLYGLTVKDFKTATEWTTTEQTKRLCQGGIDAYITAAGLPYGQEADAIQTCSARIIGLDNTLEKKLADERPYYFRTTIPKGTYETITRDITTFGIVATLVTRADVDEKTVYRLVKAVMENLDEFKEHHGAFKRLDPMRMIEDGLTAPLHPGAERYYKEQGWM